MSADARAVGSLPAGDASSRTLEHRRQQRELELAVATASALPQREAGELRFPPFRTLLER